MGAISKVIALRNPDTDDTPTLSGAAAACDDPPAADLSLAASSEIEQDARFLAQERIVDALLRALALRQPELLNTVRNILVDTEFTHTGKPNQGETVHDQIRNRLALAASFADDHGTAQKH